MEWLIFLYVYLDWVTFFPESQLKTKQVKGRAFVGALQQEMTD